MNRLPDSLPALELKGRSRPWSIPAICLIAVCVMVGLWLRLRGLSAEGFADDEVHKWFAANRYLIGDFGGDDIEHPMLMKWLIAACLAIGSHFSWKPETMVRLPNAIAGAVSIIVVAQLGRRLFGRTAALWAAGLAAVSTTLIGYQRIAKEDTLLGLFLMVVLWCCAEAKAAADDLRTRDQKRWEWLGAASLGAMLASKYFLFFAPIPVIFYFWVLGTGTQWRIPFTRWLALTGGALLVFAALNWTPFLPSNWEYGLSYSAEKKTIHGSLFFMGKLYHNLPSWWLKGTPPWFYLVFASVKLAPPTVLAAFGGLGLALWQRRPAHRLVLSWMGAWFLILSATGSKWGRFFTSVLPAFLLLAGYFSAQVCAWMKRFRFPRAAMASVGVLVTVLLVGTEAVASLRYAPHYRLYVSALGGGERNLDWFFPHCDYFDAGFREALAYLAAHAEPNAELSTEIDLPAKFYAEQFGRKDFLQTLVRRGESCRQGRVCYVIVQTGRLYFLNQDALQNLSGRQPWHTVSVRDHQVIKVYRLVPGESPFPADHSTQSLPSKRRAVDGIPTSG